MAPEPADVEVPQAVASEMTAPTTARAMHLGVDTASSIPVAHVTCASLLRYNGPMPRPSPVRDRVRDLVLSGSLHAWTIEELLARVRKDVATADYSTVFRAVSYLEEKDLIRKVDVGDGRGRYETADRHHDHVQCERCGRISESGTRCLLENAAEKVSRATGYKVLSHHLVFTGLCPECAAAG
jgi:Fe2+ or Zn2+ uptake regulation protein